LWRQAIDRFVCSLPAPKAREPIASERAFSSSCDDAPCGGRFSRACDDGPNGGRWKRANRSPARFAVQTPTLP